MEEVIKIYCPDLKDLKQTSNYFYGWKINETTYCISHTSNDKNSKEFNIKEKEEKPIILGTSINNLDKNFDLFQFKIENNRLKIM